MVKRDLICKKKGGFILEQLWSMSTTLREAERIIGFAKTAHEMNGEIWNRENQVKYQVLLIKNRFYLSPDNTQSLNGLSRLQIDLLSNLDHDFTYEEALSIFEAKNYEDPPMRGRQSMNPLKKLGLVYIKNNRVFCTDLCIKLITNEISLEEFMFDSLIKYQYPNPMESGYLSWNTKPFINTLKLIKRVNELTVQNNESPKGISTIEFGVFALSLKSYLDIDSVANRIIEFRKSYNDLPSEDRQSFVFGYIDEYLFDFNNPRKNCFEYTDNMIRYLRLTKYIYLRGKYNNTFLDLEPRRMIEINSLLDIDNGSSRQFSNDEWYDFIGTYGAYVLPFETPEALKTIASTIIEENNSIKVKLGIEPKTLDLNENTNDLKTEIQQLREERTYLQNLEIKNDYHTDTHKIDEAINALYDILNRNRANLAKKYSIELEKWANVALNIINDAIKIKPNTKVGDDNEPIFTAPAGVPDIECYYETFNSICEVTMLVGRDQWYNEGQPVMRHLRSFENNSNNKECYCIFIAPRLHDDTLNTYLMANKYGYEGYKQKIVPISIRQLSIILSKVKDSLQKEKTFKHQEFKKLLDVCSNVEVINTTSDWMNHIEGNINNI